MTVQEAVEQRVVRRHNFGLIFRHVQEISTVSDSYVHHVLLELPPRTAVTLQQHSTTQLSSIVNGNGTTRL
jgi:hypothetical protein